MITYNGKRICYSLKYGGACSKKIFKICAVLFLVYGIIFLVVSIILIIQSLFSEPGGLLLICMGISLAIGIFFIVFDRWMRRIEKEYEIWISDDNLIETQATPFEYSAHNNNRGKKVYRFGVTFMVGDKELTKYSNIYDKFFEAHRDKQLNILYSPRYDEVMIVHDE